AIAHAPAQPPWSLFRLVLRFASRRHGFRIGRLGGGEACLVDAVVDPVVDEVVDGIDLRAKLFRAEVEALRPNAVESAVQHADDLGGLVGDDGLPPLVPEHRHRHPAAVVGHGAGIELVEVVRAIERITRERARGIAVGAELPAVLLHQPVDDGDGDRLLKSLELAEDEGPVRPGAGERDIETIAAGLRGEAALPRGTGTAVVGDPVAEGTLAPLEAAAGRLGIVPLVVPAALDKQSHDPVLCFPELISSAAIVSRAAYG